LNSTKIIVAIIQKVNRGFAQLKFHLLLSAMFRTLLDSVSLPPVVHVEMKKPELQPLNLQPQNLLQWSSEESGFMEWDATSESQKTLNDSSSALSRR